MTELKDENGRPVGTVLTAIAASALAAMAVLVLVGVLVLVFGQRSNSGAGSQETVAGLTPGAPAGSVQPGDGPTGDPAAGDRSATDPAGGTAGSDPTADSQASESSAAAAATAPADARVVVLNATSRPGLAGRFQQVLQARGWNVVAIGNFRGNIPATTVYYPQGQRAAAEALDAQFPQVNRVRPAFSGISQTRLTVVLTGDFTG